MQTYMLNDVENLMQQVMPQSYQLTSQSSWNSATVYTIWHTRLVDSILL